MGVAVHDGLVTSTTLALGLHWLATELPLVSTTVHVQWCDPMPRLEAVHWYRLGADAEQEAAMPVPSSVQLTEATATLSLGEMVHEKDVVGPVDGSSCDKTK